MNVDLALLKKIKALAERGVGGERESARRILDRLMNDNCVSDRDLYKSDERRWKFRTKYEEYLLIQIIAKVLAESNRELDAFTRGRKKYMYTNCSETEADKITVYFNVYNSDMQKYFKDCFSAFVRANNIYGIPINEQRKISEEEQKRLLKIEMMSLNVEKSKLPIAQIEVLL